MHTNPPFDSDVKLNTRLLPMLVVGLILLQLAFPHRVWSTLLVGMGGLWLVSYVWIRSLAQSLRLIREMRYGWAQVGDRLEERFTIINAGTLCVPALWIEITDHGDMPDYRASRVTGVGSYGSARWRTGVTCKRRGLFTLGPTTVRTGDPFGLYTLTLRFAQTRTLVVAPPVVPLPAIEVASAGRTGDGPPRTNGRTPSISAASVREYTPGDSLRWIHWRTTARRDAFYVRRFDDTPASDWWICLDVDAGVQLGEPPASTDEYGIILAASLADRGLRAGRAVGLVAHGQQLVWVPPETGEGQRMQLLRQLAVIQRGECPLGDLLERSRLSLAKHTSLIVITPSLDRAWIEALLLLRRRGAKPTVLLLDLESFEGEHDARTRAMQTWLSSLGIPCHLITKAMLDRPEARPGRQGTWEWHVLGTGRAVPVRQPDDMTWKSSSEYMG